VVSSFNIQLDLSTITTAADKAVFSDAAAKWQRVITSDLSDFNTNIFAARTDSCTWPTVIDDLFICAEYQPYDGPYNVLGFAGPEWVRVPSGLPISGSMTFDVADLSYLRGNGGNGFLSTILHEMGHVIGKLD
jgi:hypothetical protein